MSAEVTVSEVSAAPKAIGSRPFWSKCADCLYCWAAAYLPMSAEKFCKVIGRKPRCPRCAGTNIVVAKQNDGVLLEPQGE